eukprot:14433912-Alexandrium_andersonii.AAC.1
MHAVEPGGGPWEMGTRPVRGRTMFPTTLQSFGRLSMRASGCCAPCCPITLLPCTQTPSSRVIVPRNGLRLRRTPSSNTEYDVLSWPFRHVTWLKAE